VISFPIRVEIENDGRARLVLHPRYLPRLLSINPIGYRPGHPANQVSVEYGIRGETAPTIRVMMRNVVLDEELSGPVEEGERPDPEMDRLVRERMEQLLERERGRIGR
jgi:hypothetical protein